MCNKHQNYKIHETNIEKNKGGKDTSIVIVGDIIVGDTFNNIKNTQRDQEENGGLEKHYRPIN